MHPSRIGFCIGFCFCWSLVSAQPIPTASLDSLTVEAIMQPPHWIGHAPSDWGWDPQGDHLYFQWNPEPTPGDSLYRVSAKGGAPTPVPPAIRQQLPPEGANLSPDRKQLVFSRNGDLHLYTIREESTQPLTQTLRRETGPSFDQEGKRIFFEVDDNAFALHLETGLTEQLTDFRRGQAKTEINPAAQRQWLLDQEQQLIQALQAQSPEDATPEIERPQPYYYGQARMEQLVVSPDGRFITFRLRYAAPGGNKTEVPAYIRESGYTESLSARPKVGSGQATFAFGIYDRTRDTVQLLETAQLPGIDRLPDFMEAAQQASRSQGESVISVAREVMVMGPNWSADSRHAVLEIRSLDFKDRWLARLDPVSGLLQTLDHQRDEAWIDGPGIRRWLGRAGDQGWLPDQETFWYISESTGFAHLYSVDMSSRKPRQMTTGSFEVSEVQVGPKGAYWYFTTNQIHPGERHVYRLSVDGGIPERLTFLPGRTQFKVSPDGKTLALRHSTSHQPWEILLQDNSPKAKAEPITASTSEAFRSYPWREPEVITIPARDGERVQARLYLPREEIQPDGKAVIFVHGAGYLQNAHRWWSSYFREYMFHNLLADQGYVVLDLDYRGSAGYGRDWRTAIYRHMGNQDLTDQVDAAQFLVDQFQVDPQRIGIYGGSYGGFLTLMAMFTEPDVFAAGAALRPVTDWAHYNHPYTASILNQPQDDSLAYQRSSPIYFAEGLQGALLICHGMLDTNVHFQDVVRLNQRLIELGKRNWSVAMYPLEGHGFTHASSWTDEYQRIYDLFEQHLNP